MAGYVLGAFRGPADAEAWRKDSPQVVPASGSEATGLFNEYFFYTRIESMRNQQHLPITKRQAMALRDKVGEVLLENQSVQDNMRTSFVKQDSFGHSGKGAMINAMDRVFQESVPGYVSDREQMRSMYDASLSEFKTMTARQDSEAVLPLSPYAPGLRYRKAALDSGNRLMFARMNDLGAEAQRLAQADTSRSYPSLDATLSTGRVNLYKREPRMEKDWPDINLDDKRMMDRANLGPSMTISDKSGASLMRLLMDEKTYQKLERNINAGMRTRDGKVRYADPVALRRSYDVIRGLQEQGIMGTFEKDRRSGQVRYVIPTQAGRTEAMSGSDNLEIRAIDPYEPNMMAARVYQSGITYRFSTDRKVTVQANGRSRSQVDNYANPSVEDCMNLIKFARGEAICTTDGASFVGAPSMMFDNTKAVARQSGALVNGAYMSSNGDRPRVSRYGPVLDDQGRDTGYSVVIRCESDAERPYDVFDTPESAEQYLRDSIDSAHVGFRAELNVDGLIREYESVKDTEALADYQPAFSGNKIIASVQERYWSVLKGENKDLARLDASDMDAVDVDDPEATGDSLFDKSQSDVYAGTQEEKVRQHAKDLEYVMLGQFEPDASGKRFNAANVANYMGENTTYRNSSNLISAMKTCGITYQELRGNDFYNQAVGDRMIQFDEASAKPINDPSLDPWIRARGETILKSLNHAGLVNRSDALPRSTPQELASPYSKFKPGDFITASEELQKLNAEKKAAQTGREEAALEAKIKNTKKSMSGHMKGLPKDFWDGTQVTADSVLIDKNGVVKYDVCRIERMGAADSMLKPMTGYIGQLMPPDEHGVVQTNFAASRNFEFIPVAQATVVADDFKNGRPTPVAERMRLTDYDRFIDQAIEATIARDSVARPGTMGTTTSLNSAVRHMSSRRYDIGELDKLPEDQRTAIKDTKFVRMSTDLVTGSNQDTIFKAQQGMSTGAYDIYDDMRVDPMVVTGYRDMMQLYQDYAGYLDIKYTGLAGSQGKQLAMADGAKLDASGKIIPVTDENGKPVDSPAPITKYLEDGHFCQFDKRDRENMGGAAVLQGKNHLVANVAMIPMGGWTFEDQVVMSKDFAERLGVTNLGDKVSDYHGNKGVTGLIIDPEMPEEEARRRGLEDVVAWFRANDGMNGRPRLDIVQNMGSAFSRSNGGLYREAMFRGSGDLLSPSGEVYPGGLGKLDIVRMEQTAEHKSSDLTVEEEDEAHNLGARTSRNDGAQAGWAHIANNRWDAMTEAGRRNGRAWEDAREYLNLFNIDFDETGNLHFGIREHEGEHRAVFETQPLQYDGQGRVRTSQMLSEFGIAAERQGGYIEIPFPIKFPEVEGAKDAQGNPISAGETPEIPDEERSPESRAAYPGKVYRLPLLSAGLRTGQEYDDESAKFHDYTSRYQKIMTSAYKYRDSAMKLMERDKLSPEDIRKHEGNLVSAQQSAQSQYDMITDDVKVRKILGKKNMFRSSLLSTKRAATTLVALHDPRLPAGVSSMSTDAAKAIGFSEREIERSERTYFKPNQVSKLMKKAEHAPFRVVTRDPVIVHTGESAERFALDDRAPEGGGKYVISANTAVYGAQKQMDHDGDTEAVFACSREDLHLMGQETRMLDMTDYDPEKKQYKLFYGKAQDLAIGWAVHPERKDSYDELATEINDSERTRRDLDSQQADMMARYDAGKMSQAEYAEQDARLSSAIWDSDRQRYDQLTRLSQHMVDSFSDAYLDKLEGKLEKEKMPYMNFTSAETVIRSLDNIQAIGYKGKPKQLDDFAKVLGVSYERNKETGEIDYGTFQDHGKSGLSYEEMGLTCVARAFQQLHTGNAGYKTIGSTGLAGRDPVYGNMTGRFIGVPEAIRNTELATSLVTQRTLQVKHGPDDVEVMQKIEKALNLLDQGVAMDYVPTKTAGMQWTAQYDQNGNTIPLTPQEFAKTFERVYNGSAEEGGMGFRLNPEIIQTIADIRTDPKNPNRVLNVNSAEDRAVRMSGLHRLAYKGGGKSEMQALYELAGQGANMFCPDGQKEPSEWNRPYMPDAIARNIEAQRYNEAHPDDIQPMTPISKSVKGPRKLFTKTAEMYVHMKGGRLETPEPVDEPEVETEPVSSVQESVTEPVNHEPTETRPFVASEQSRTEREQALMDAEQAQSQEKARVSNPYDS